MPQKQKFDALTAMPMGLPRGVGAQQVEASAAVVELVAAGVQQADAASVSGLR